MAALQWRTVSSGTATAFIRQPHAVRPTARIVRVQASIVNPHSILGVSPAADVKEVKRAYRKLALQYHPDVCKTEDGHQRFMALTQAYEMVLGRAEGKTDPNHASATGWDFHDWYWNFRMQRSWEKQQRQAKAAVAAATAAAEGRDPSQGDGCGGDPRCGRRPPPSAHAGYKQPEGRANLRSQLAGLRHRAAVRANRSTAHTAGAAASGAGTGPSSPATWSAASGWSLDGDDCPPDKASSWSSSGPRAASSTVPEGAWAPSSGPLPSWSWSWDDTLDLEESDCEDAAPAPPPAAAMAPDHPAKASAAAAPANGDQDLNAAGGGLHHQYTHVYGASAAAASASAGLPEQMAMQDGHLATVVGVANHAVPFAFPAAAAAGSTARASSAQSPSVSASAAHPHPHRHPHQQQPQTHHLGVATTTTADATIQQHQQQPNGFAHEPEPESPFSNPFERGRNGYQPPHARRRGFHADSATREAVSHQLTGLRRKAAIKSAYWGGVGANKEGGAGGSASD